MKELIVECQQCGELFIVPVELGKDDVLNVQYSIKMPGYVKTVVEKEIKHECSDLNIKLLDVMSGPDIERYADHKVFGICKVIGIVQE